MVVTIEFVLLCRNFIFKDLPQLQFKNRAVQFLTMKNQMPHGNLKLFYGRRHLYPPIMLSAATHIVISDAYTRN